MNVKELEKQIRSLPPQQLQRFSQWFDDYRQQIPSSPASADLEDDPTPEQKEEILRRRAAYLADPNIATPWEGTPERLIKQLRARRRQKTSSRRS
jgi:hypothetical protein